MGSIEHGSVIIENRQKAARVTEVSIGWRWKRESSYEGAGGKQGLRDKRG